MSPRLTLLGNNLGHLIEAFPLETVSAEVRPLYPAHTAWRFPSCRALVCIGLQGNAYDPRNHYLGGKRIDPGSIILFLKTHFSVYVDVPSVTFQ